MHARATQDTKVPLFHERSKSLYLSHHYSAGVARVVSGDIG